MIIFLNGASSSGKSSIGRALQIIANTENFLLLGIDTFIKMMPFGSLGFDHFSKEGFFFEYEKNTKLPRIKITTGEFGDKIVKGSAKTCEILANDGFNLIVDEVLLELKSAKYYVEALKKHRVYFVKVFCELKILQEREMMRGDRAWGLAHEQFYSLHRPEFQYDFEVNSSRATPFEIAEQILTLIKKNSQPIGFNNMEKIIKD